MVNIKKLLTNFRKIVLLLIIVFVLSGIYLITTIVFGSTLKTQEKTAKIHDTDKLIEQLDRSVQSVKQKILIKKSRIAVNSPNPETDPKINNALSQPKVTLNGIARSDEKIAILINNQILGLGDTIEELQIVEINEESVTLKGKEGKDKVIYLYENR